MEAGNLTRFLDVPLEVEALIKFPGVRVRDLLALKAGSVIETGIAVGGNVGVTVGSSPVGVGELTASRGKTVVRMLAIGDSK